MELLGTIIKDARLQAGITRKELAEKLEITPRHLKYIENNHRKPSLKLLFKIVRELSIPGDRIFYPERKAPHTNRE